MHGFALLTAASIFVLICSGGLVTSKGAGLAVPDWPTSYGYNMFAFPISRWVGGVFYEHVHRLIASIVGLMTVGLAVWAWLAEPRRWVRRLAYAATVAVVLQGILGGLRVVWLKDHIGIFHAMLAQAFFAAVCLLGLVTAPAWLRRIERAGNFRAWMNLDNRLLGLGRAALFATLLIYVQLALGASMRHEHAGLSIPDFPTAYGQWWPRTDSAAIVQINAARTGSGQMPTTPTQIYLQMAHRIGAALILIAVLASAWQAWTGRARLHRDVRWLALSWPLLLAGQITLGIYTIWTNKAADVATLHVAVGAMSLLWGVLLVATVSRECYLGAAGRALASGDGQGTTLLPATGRVAVSVGPERPADVFARG